MDALLAAVLDSAPSWGVGGLLLTYVVILIRREARVDERHSAALDQLDRLHASSLERIQRDHDAEVAELQRKIHDLRRELDDVDQALRAARAEILGLPDATRPRWTRRTLDPLGELRGDERHDTD